MEINGTNVSMKRGNTDSLTLSIALNGVAAPFVTGDTVKLALKAHINDREPVLSKQVTSFTNGAAVFNFAPADTKDLIAKEYLYDAVVIYADNTSFYFIEVSTFKIEATVTPI